jgi:hypothetical protein
MAIPAVHAWIEESRKCAGLWIQSSDIGTFETVVVETRQCEIHGPCLAAMFPGNYMINLKWQNG